MNETTSNPYADCDKEPIEFIGAIQAHGCVLGFDLVDYKLVAGSGNALSFLGIEISVSYGKSLEAMLGPDVAQKVMNLLGEAGDAGAHGSIKLHNTRHEIFVFTSEDVFFVEFTPEPITHDEQQPRSAFLQREAARFISEVQSKLSVEEASYVLCRHIRRITGFDRVMMYRFLPNWDGEVVAEDKTPEAHSFKHHRFPAHDIPTPARELYLRNRSRLILDTQSSSLPLNMTRDYTKKKMSLAASKLRAVPAVHLEYLANMGVRSSFSVAVIYENRLWGLVSCHANQPTLVSHEVKIHCETIAGMFAMAVGMLEKNKAKDARIEFDAKLKNIVHHLRLSSDPLKDLFQNHAAVLEAFQATGMAFVGEGRCDIAGLTPLIGDIRSIAAKINERMQGGNRPAVALDSLRVLDAKWEELRNVSAGVLAVGVASVDDSVFMLFRPEVVQNVVWGGDPRPALERRSYGGTINPRKSFESWIETVKFQSIPWHNHEIQGCVYLRDVVFDALERRERLIKELGALNGKKS